MTTTTPLPDSTRCPQCSAPLDDPAACSTCALRLTGPEASRLWQVDQELLRLDAARGPLLLERSTLLAALRGVRPTAPALPPVVVESQVLASPQVQPAPEWTQQRVSRLLLGLGGLLLAGAGVVFAAVTYERLGAGGRAAILLALTVAAAVAVPRARLRGLASTAETLAVVALVLAALDAYGLRTLGLAAGSEPLAYAAGSAAVLAVLSAGYAVLVPVRAARAAAVLLAQLPAPLLLLDLGPSLATVGLVLAAQVALDLAAVALLRSRGWVRADVLATTAASAAVVTVPALMAAAAAALGDQPRAGAAALLACAGVLAAAASLSRDATARLVLSAAPVGVVALAAHALARGGLTEEQSPLVPVAVALLAVQVAALLPRALRTGPVAGALLVAAAAVVAVADQVLLGLLGPAAWLADPWTLAPGSSARTALSPTMAWTGTVVSPAVLAAAALTAVGAGLAMHRLREGAALGAALAAGALALLPLGLDLPHGAAVLVLLVAGAAAVLVPRPLRVEPPLSVAGIALLLLAAAWSLADQTATLLTLGLVAAALTGLALRTPRPVLAGTAAALGGLLAAAELGAAGAARDLAVEQVGALLVVAAAALAALAAPYAGAERRAGLEMAGVVLGLAAIVLAAPDAGWLSWTLAGLALVALAVALRADRRAAAVAGGLLLSASSWVRLADAGVTAPEPYVLPLAAVALVLGHLRRRAVPTTGSSAAYGAGLSVLLVPSLLDALDGGPLWRPLGLLVVALGVVLVGAQARLKAPLAIGGVVLAADALVLLAPYAASLPRWLVLGTAGALLLGVGATYEQRLREVVRLRKRFEALA